MNNISVPSEVLVSLFTNKKVKMLSHVVNLTVLSVSITWCKLWQQFRWQLLYWNAEGFLCMPYIHFKVHSKISSVIFAVLKVINSQRVELTIYCVKQHSCSVLLYGVISLLHWKCGIKNPPNSLDSAPQWLRSEDAIFSSCDRDGKLYCFSLIKLHGKTFFVDNFTQDMIGGEHISNY